MSRSKNLFGCLVIFSLTAISAPVQTAIKCWKNDEGVKECGNQVPPQYVQKGYEEIDKQGITVKETDRALTPKEAEEAKRLAEIEAEKNRQKAEKIRQDKILLDTFSSTDDIKLTRDDRTAAIDSVIKLTKKRREKMQKSLDEKIALTARTQQAGKEISERQEKEMQALRERIQKTDEYLAEKQKEKTKTEAEYSKKIERYIELTSSSKQ